MLDRKDQRGDLNADEIALVIDGRHHVEIALGLRLDAARPEHPGIGDQKVESAECPHCPVDRLLDRCALRDVDRQAGGPAGAGAGADLIGGLLDALDVHVGEDDMRSLRGEVLRNLEAEALRRPGHKGDFSDRPARGRRGGGNLLPVRLHLPVLDEPVLLDREGMNAGEFLRTRHHLDCVEIDPSGDVGRGEVVSGGEHSQALHKDDARHAPALGLVVGDGRPEAVDQLGRGLARRRLEPKREGGAIDDLIWVIGPANAAPGRPRRPQGS